MATSKTKVKIEDDLRYPEDTMSERVNKRKGLESEDGCHQLETEDKVSKKGRGLGHMARWEDMFARLLKFRADHGHCLVPNRYPEDPKLGTWVATQRRQYKVLMSGSTESTPLTPERAMRLQQIGFSWSPKESDSWDGFYKEYVDFVAKYGVNQVAKLLGEESPLTKWEAAQRNEYALLRSGSPSRLTPDRVNKLNEINFNWGVKEPNKFHPSMSLSMGATASMPDAKSSIIDQISKFSGRRSMNTQNSISGDIDPAVASILGNPLLQNKRRELQERERERELEMIMRSLQKPKPDLSTINNRNLDANRLGIASSLGMMSSPALFQTDADVLSQGLDQIRGQQEASRSSWLNSVSLNAPTTLGSLHPLQNSLQSSLQNSLLQNSLQNSLDLQSAGLPSLLNGPSAQGLLASLGGGALSGKESGQSEVEALLAGRVSNQPNLLLSEYLRNENHDLAIEERKRTATLSDLLEADCDSPQEPKRRKY